MAKTKQERQAQREHARLLYMQGVEQKIIAAHTGASPQSISKWAREGQWSALRAGNNITRQELTNKLLIAIDSLIASAADDPDKQAALATQLSKYTAILDKLDKQTTVVDYMETFKLFGSWLIERCQTDRECSTELVKSINRYQDLFVGEVLSRGVS